MKITKLVAALAVSCCLAGPTAFGQEGEQESSRPRRQRDRGASAERGEGQRGPRGDRPEGQRGPAAGMMRLPLMVALDTDGNGEISAEEIANATASLKKLDKNKDGKLTVDELRPQGGPGQGRPGSGGPEAGQRGPAQLLRMFDNFDKNGDGKLSGDEIPPPMVGRVERLDTNGDGAIDKEEVAKLQQILERGQRPGRERGAGRQKGDGSGVKPNRPERE